MKRYLCRTITLVLISCLLVDPITASVFRSQQPLTMGSGPSALFDEQALAAPFVNGWRRLSSKFPLMGSLWSRYRKTSSRLRAGESDYFEKWRTAWETKLQAGPPPNATLAHDPSRIARKQVGPFVVLNLFAFTQEKSAGQTRSLDDPNPNVLQRTDKSILMEDPFGDEHFLTTTRWPQTYMESRLWAKSPQPHRLTRGHIVSQLEWTRHGAVAEFHSEVENNVDHLHSHLYPSKSVPIAEFGKHFEAADKHGPLEIGFLKGYPVPHIAVASSDLPILADATYALANLLTSQGVPFRYGALPGRDAGQVIVSFALLTAFSDPHLPFRFDAVGFITPLEGKWDRSWTEEEAEKQVRQSLRKVPLDEAFLRRLRQEFWARLTRQKDRRREREIKKRVVDTIQRAFFGEYWPRFNEVTNRAPVTYRNRDWPSSLDDPKERILLYRPAIDWVVEKLEEIAPLQLKEEAFWNSVKRMFKFRIWSFYIWGFYESDLAMTFFNSVRRKIFLPEAKPVEYLDDGIVERSFIRPRAPYKRRYRLPHGRISPELIMQILEDGHFGIPFDNLQRDSALAAERLNHQLKQRLGHEKLKAGEILEAVFYRNKGAYVVGRITTGKGFLPLVLSLLNPGEGLTVDAALCQENDVTPLFSFTRSNFHVSTQAYREVVAFLSSIMPSKDLAAIYSSIGFIHPAKIQINKEVRKHIQENPNAMFVATEGEKGAIMVTFTLPGIRYVFKIISDTAEKDDRIPRSFVERKYHWAHVMDRVGRMLDAMLFRNLVFPRKMFPPELLKEMLERAPSVVAEQGDFVILKHVYVERRVRPGDIALRQAGSLPEIRKIVSEIIGVIKDLAASGIWIGDVKPKNYGMTEYTHRGVSFDYDELEDLLKMEFMDHLPPHIPAGEDEPPQRDTDYIDQHIYHRVPVARLISNITADLPGPLASTVRDILEREHAEVFHAEYWHKMQARIRAGQLPDVFPHSPSKRLHLWMELANRLDNYIDAKRAYEEVIKPMVMHFQGIASPGWVADILPSAEELRHLPLARRNMVEGLRNYWQQRSWDVSLIEADLEMISQISQKKNGPGTPTSGGGTGFSLGNLYRWITSIADFLTPRRRGPSPTRRVRLFKQAA